MDRPEYGTAPIKCSKRGCGWTGLETELTSKPHPKWPNASVHVCPKCGCDSYVFVKRKGQQA